jgi:hypothetical protein
VEFIETLLIVAVPYTFKVVIFPVVIFPVTEFKTGIVALPAEFIDHDAAELDVFI